MPRTTLMEKKSYDFEDLDLPVTCPAGERIGETLEGPGCRCRIEGSTITSARDGSSLAIFCTGEHTMCPTWRVARETEWEHESVMRITETAGVRRNYTVEDLAEIEERMQAGDVDGARAIQRRIYESRRAQGLVDVTPE